MTSGYIFSLQPTFTQGFILGQLSILALLAAVIKYLFLDTEPAQNVAERTSSVSQPTRSSAGLDGDSTHVESESTEWLNALLHQVCRPSTFHFHISTWHLRNQVANVYRSKLRNDLQGVEGDEVLRRRVEDFVNHMRPSGVLVSAIL